VSGKSARRDLALLSAGQAVSVTGDSAALVALMLRVRPFGSGWTAALLAAELLPFVLCAPVSGRIVDRIETRRVLLAALIGQGVVAGALAIATPPWSVVTCFAALNALATLVRPATSALIPAAVGPVDAARGYARLATGTGLGWIAGPALGGLLTGILGTTTTLLIDAATFGVLAGAVAFLRARRAPTHPAPGQQEPRAWDGFALLWQARVARLAVLTSAAAIGCAVVDNVAAPFRFVNQLGASDLGYGLYLSIWGAGALLATQLTTRISAQRQPAALAVGNLLTGLGIGAIGLAPNIPSAFVASGVGGAGNGLENVIQNALVAAHTPIARHGQIFAAAGAIVQTAIGVGTAVAAPLVTALGANYAMVTAGALAATVAAYALLRATRLPPLSGPSDH
jgi:MFS family permease